MTTETRRVTRGELIFDKSNILILMLLLLPIFIKNFYYLQIFDIIGIYIIFSMSINILSGFLGQISFGHAGFWAIGAYTSALLSTKLHFPFALDLISALILAGIFGFLLGLPALRIRGHYLALATLSFGLIIHLILLKWMGLTNGPNGINDIPKVSLAGIEIDTEVKFYYVLWFFLIASHVFCKHLKFSRIGYAMQSVKEDEVASSMVGINITKIKLLGFMISAMVAGLSGSLFAHFMGFICPDLFSLDASIVVVMIVVLGGFGNLSAPWLGSILIVGSSEYFRFLGHYREIAYGIIILIALIFMPQGIWGAFSAIIKKVIARLR